MEGAEGGDCAAPVGRHGKGGDRGDHGMLWQMMAQIPSWARALVAVGFIFTIWSVFTGFSLGEIMNKYADADLKQSQMQFEAQLQMQRMQHDATKESNEKLDSLIKTISDVAKKLQTQGDRIEEVSARLFSVEATVGLVVKWTCRHETKHSPSYCEALLNKGK